MPRPEMAGRGMETNCPSPGMGKAYAWHFHTPPTKIGLPHRGPSLVVALGRLIIASGPAACSPLNGVLPEKPQADAAAGSLNQNPTWKVLVGGSGGDSAGSKPKI